MENIQSLPSKTYSFATEHKPAFSAATTTLLVIGILALLGFILTQSGALQSILDKYSILLSSAQKFNIIVATSTILVIGLLPPACFLALYATGYCLTDKEKRSTSSQKEDEKDHSVDNPKESSEEVTAQDIDASQKSTLETHLDKASPKPISPFPAPFQIKKMNLGDNGQVDHEAHVRFKDISQKIGSTASFSDCAMTAPAKQPKTNHDFKSGISLGRSKYLEKEHVTLKERKPGEDPTVMAKEATAQHFLNTKKKEWGLHSSFPRPLYWDDDCLIYDTPKGYHHYLTDIDSQEEFDAAMQVCTHDLGRLLREGIAYPSLISIFHHVSDATDKTISRIYTLFPHWVGHRAKVKEKKEHTERWGTMSGGMTTYGMFPGEIEHVCAPDHHLYPNLGAAGIRDLGDFQTIADFVSEMNRLDKNNSECTNTPVTGTAKCTEAMAVAHFISLYQLTLMLIIAKRAQRQNLWDKKALVKSFTQACHSLITAFVPMDKKDSDALLQHMTATIDAEKFFQQMRFSFTKEDRSTIWKHENTDIIEDYQGKPMHFNEGNDEPATPSFLPSDAAVKSIWGEHAIWTLYMLRGTLLSGRYVPKTGFDDTGSLGNDSAPNPLVEGILAIFNFTYLATENYFKK